MHPFTGRPAETRDVIPDGPEFLGSGWAYPPALRMGGVAVSKGECKVRESIRIILETRRGERVMRPDFGCGIHEMVFEIINASTLNSIRESVREALVLWEPRIEVLNVWTSTNSPSHASEQAHVLVSIDYRIRATNSRSNLVYPFYIKA